MQAAFEKFVDLFYLKCAVLFTIHEKNPSKLTILPKKSRFVMLLCVTHASFQISDSLKCNGVMDNNK